MNSMLTLLVLGVFYTTASGDLTCRRCIKATSLDDCTTNVRCSSNEQCYMDQKITEQYNIEFTAGCRANDPSTGDCIYTTKVHDHVVTTTTTITVSSRSASDSRCCDKADVKGCNSKLCGIKSSNLNSSQCYFCDHTANGDQGDVKNPEDCVTLTTCQSDEVCFAQQSVLGTDSTWTYGCFQKRMCQLLMNPLLEDMKRCYVDNNKEACGYHRRSQSVCTICCGDGGCNFGTCEDIKIRIYNLYANGFFNTTTMKTKPGAGLLLSTVIPIHSLTTSGP